MTQFEIKEAKEIPFFDHGDSLLATAKTSSKRREMGVCRFILRKLKNIILYRLAYFCPFNSWRIKMHRWRGVNIGEHCYIAQQCSIDNAYPEYIYIEDYAGVNQGVTLLAHTNMHAGFKGLIECKVAPVVVRHHAVVSINSIVLPGVEIEEYAIVSAGSVVANKVKSYTMVMGNPAKKVLNYKHMLDPENQE